MCWIDEWARKNSIIARYDGFFKQLLRCWFYYDDPIEDHEWQMMADIYISN